MPLPPFADSQPLLDQPEALRAQMERDGYLFVSDLLPKEAVEALYAAIMAICREQGWVDADNLALGEPRLEGYPEWWAVYDPLQRLEAFHAFAHRPEILRLVEAIVQEPVLVHPRNIARITFPGAAHYTTPPHQDYPLIQGTPQTYTAWIPLCDCPQSLGGLAVLAGSHTMGLLPVHRASGPGGLSVETEQFGLTWHGQDMRAGDLLLFHSHTVHRALPNASDRRLRVSADYRYQGVAQPVVEDSLMPHYGRMGWDEIYEGWQQEALKYYWKRLPVNITARNFEIMQPVEMR